MTDPSPRLSLPFLQPAQAQKHVTHNEAVEKLDLLVQLTVVAFGATTPPALPQTGQVWALGPAPSGAWAGQGDALAAWVNGAWAFITPQPGWRAVQGSDLRVFTGAAWVRPAPQSDDLPGIGINAAHDTTNRLTVSAPATLFSHEGAGHQLKLNKAAAGDTASLLYQSGFSGRAEAGLAGSDDFSVKVSPDGSAWHDAIVVNRSTGQVSLPNGLAVTGAITGSGAASLPSLRSSDSDTGEVSAPHDRAVIAAGTSRASGDNTLVAASGGSHAAGDRNAILGGSNCLIRNGNRNFMGGGNSCTIDGANTSAILASLTCELTANQAMIVAGRRVINAVHRSVALGDAGSGDPLTSNRKIHMFADSGDIQIAGSLTSSHTFSDFAEMFPNATGVEIPPGTIVTEAGGAVRPAGPGDEIAGVVTATAVITAGDTPFAWQGRYLADEWGRPVMQDIPDPDHEGGHKGAREGCGPAPLISARVENPDWNPGLPQVPRSERPGDWTRVGLLGQVFTRVGEDVVPGDRLSAMNGTGVRSTGRTGLRCMVITQPYDTDKGYAVAKCLINVAV